MMEEAWLSCEGRDLSADDPRSNLQIILLNGLILGDPRGKFTTLCKN